MAAPTPPPPANPEPNWANRTIWTGDNLDVLRGLDSATVDLIYLDPPFNSNRDYAAPIGSQAAGAAFKDTWTLSDLDVAWAGYIADEEPALAHLLDATGMTHSKSMQSYLTMMAVRLIELRRVLKPTGSLYLHCDDTASHYLKHLLDVIFGAQRVRNEIIWVREIGTKNSAKRYPRNTDRLLFATKGDKWVWNPPTVPASDEQIDIWYTEEDERGRYTRRQLRRPSEGMPVWRGLRHGTGSWNAPKTGHDAEWIEREFIPGYRSIESAADRLEALDAAGLLHWPDRKGGLPSLKKYLKYADTTVPMGDVWTDIPGGRALPKAERVGYPTQKPLTLLRRIIEASSNPGDIVLDPFCGCATACVAAEQVGRQWVGIDLSDKAHELVVRRLSEAQNLYSFEKLGEVHHRRDIPQRTDIDAPKDYRTHKHVLYGQQQGYCAGCGVHFEFRNLTIDHIWPRSRGGQDNPENLQLLCGSCNSLKGNRPMEYLMAELEKRGHLATV